MNDIISLFAFFHQDLLKYFDPNPHLPFSKEHLCDGKFLPSLWMKLQNERFFDDCCSAMGFVEAMTIKLDETDSYQYVPILPSLSSYLSHQDVQSAIL